MMYPLLSYATNLGNPEAEVLVEEALKCWGVALAGMIFFLVFCPITWVGGGGAEWL